MLLSYQKSCILAGAGCFSPHLLFLWLIKEKEDAPLAVEKKKKALWVRVAPLSGRPHPVLSQLPVLTDLRFSCLRCRWYTIFATSRNIRQFQILIAVLCDMSPAAVRRASPGDFIRALSRGPDACVRAGSYRRPARCKDSFQLISARSRYL